MMLERRAPSRPVSNPNVQRAETVLGVPIASWWRVPVPRRRRLLTSPPTVLNAPHQSHRLVCLPALATRALQLPAPQLRLSTAIPPVPATSPLFTSASWTAVASAARHRFCPHGTRGKFETHRPPESAVAAPLCRRSPRHSAPVRCSDRIFCRAREVEIVAAVGAGFFRLALDKLPGS